MRIPQLIATLASAALLFCSCDMIEYHPYDVKITGQTDINSTNSALIERLCAGKDTVRFAQMSDTQRFYDDTELIVADINRRHDIDFVIHTGDMTDFGLPKEYMWQRDMLNRLRVPYICAIGNHDCLGTGLYAYRKVLGSDNFSFNASFLHLVSLNTNSGEYDYSPHIPDLDFMAQDAATMPDSIAATVVAMHVAPGMTLFNDDMASAFDRQCHAYRNLLFCICGHDHHFSLFHPFGEQGTLYFQCDDAKSRSYIIYIVTRDSFDYELVEI